MSCGNVVTITGSQCDDSELRNEREDTARTVQSIDSEPGHTSGSGRQRRHGLNGTRSAENRASFFQNTTHPAHVDFAFQEHEDILLLTSVLDCMRHDWQSSTAPDLVTSTVHNPRGRH